MNGAVDDCSVVLQQWTSTLSRNSSGETKRVKMDQPQTRFEESAVFTGTEWYTRVCKKSQLRELSIIRGGAGANGGRLIKFYVGKIGAGHQKFKLGFGALT